MIKEIWTRLPAAGLAVLLMHAPCALAQQTAAEARQAIVGTWTLVKDVNKGADGVETSAFGATPLGQIIFTSNMRFMSFNARSDLPKYAAGNRKQGTADEYKAIAQGSIATYGSYSISDDGKYLLMKVDSSTYTNWNGTEQKRSLYLSGDEMRYTVNASVGGVSELSYRRLK